jgi:hypothetical protein
MQTEQTVAVMNVMKLHGMARSFNERLGTPQHAGLSHAEFVGLLVQDEKTNRDNLRLRRLLRDAKLKQSAALEDIDYTHARGLNKQIIVELSGPQWIVDHRTVLLPALWETSRLDRAMRSLMFGRRECSLNFNKLGETGRI